MTRGEGVRRHWKPKLLHPANYKVRKLKFSAFDIETEGWTIPVLIGFYDGEKYHEFREVHDFLEYFLSHKYRQTVCYAHNGGKFDFAFLLKCLDEDFPEWEYTIIEINGKIVQLRLRDRKGHSWSFRDSTALFNMKLEKLARAFDVFHQKLEFDYSRIKKNMPEETYRELSAYLIHDTKGLYEIIEKAAELFREKFNTPLRLTMASQAMAIYRTNYMNQSLINLTKRTEEFVRKAYCGGRVEIFKMVADRKFYYYDVNSLYPTCMIKYPMPVGKPKKVDRFVDDTIGFYKAAVRLPDMYIPPLPIKYRHKLIFPVGYIEGWFVSNELQKVMDMGGSVEVKEGYIFNNQFIFKDYVDTFYDIKRTTSDSTMRLIAKLAMNALYGKFGETRDRKSVVKLTDYADRERKIPFMPEYNLFEVKTRAGSPHIIPSISTWITACARLELLDWMLKCEDDLYYCDTDSVITGRKLPTGKGLGQMKLEAVGNRGIFLRPKVYILEGVKSRHDGTKQEFKDVKAKGFSRSFTKTLTHEDFRLALRGNYKGFLEKGQRFGSFRESLRRKGNFVSVLDFKKSIKSQYTKRIIHGYDTMPLRLSVGFGLSGFLRKNKPMEKVVA